MRCGQRTHRIVPSQPVGGLHGIHHQPRVGPAEKIRARSRGPVATRPAARSGTAGLLDPYQRSCRALLRLATFIWSPPFRWGSGMGNDRLQAYVNKELHFAADLTRVVRYST